MTASLTQDDIDDISARLMAAIEAGDADGVRAIYAPDALLWHNFDQRDQTVDENLATLTRLHAVTSGLRYADIVRFPSPGGFVQQHTLRATVGERVIEMPAMIRFYVKDGRITRLEEYLDTAQIMPAFTGR